MRFLIFSLLLFWGQAAASNYQLGAGDQIQITVYGESDLTSQIKIDKSGVISFPFLSDIAVVGLTVKDLENTIANGLRGDYLIDPQVTVSIVMYRPFFIHGQVKRPGGYPFQEDLTLDNLPFEPTRKILPSLLILARKFVFSILISRVVGYFLNIS